ncbi:MAG: hypothetical protein GY783_03190, partial [Gammaproteobacteria bacterium]|nr:hypothetical protein [Gammaproteobacteria bacterium]
MNNLARLWRAPLPLSTILTLVLVSLAGAFSSALAAEIVELDVEDGIGVATAEYVISGIRYAEEIDAELVIINMDTPGGLVKPMRDIVQAILGSSVPVATYVTPAGARADSAGTYILLASHIAAMNPTTVLGAATPVMIGGDDATPPADSDEGQESDEDADTPAPSSHMLLRSPSPMGGLGPDMPAVHLVIKFLPKLRRALA